MRNLSPCGDELKVDMNSSETTTSGDIEDDRELAELLVDALHAPPVPDH